MYIDINTKLGFVSYKFGLPILEEIKIQQPLLKIKDKENTSFLHLGLGDIYTFVVEDVSAEVWVEIKKYFVKTHKDGVTFLHTRYIIFDPFILAIFFDKLYRYNLKVLELYSNYRKPVQTELYYEKIIETNKVSLGITGTGLLCELKTPYGNLTMPMLSDQSAKAKKLFDVGIGIYTEFDLELDYDVAEFLGPLNYFMEQSLPIYKENIAQYTIGLPYLITSPVLLELFYEYFEDTLVDIHVETSSDFSQKKIKLRKALARMKKKLRKARNTKL